MIPRSVNSALATRLSATTVVSGVVTATAAATLVQSAPLAAAGAAAAAAGVAGMLAFLAGSRTAHGLSKTAVALLDANLDVLEVMGGAVAKREIGPGAHNHRLLAYAMSLGRATRLSPREMRVLIKGAFVHDIGNVVLPDSILLKRDRLDEVEFEAVKTHCYHGADIVGRSDWLAEAAEVVRNHHEKWDGTGYPSGLSGEDIPLTARVFAVADVFDALTSDRPHRPPLPFDKALDILLMGRGGHFDPAVVDAFAPMARGLYDEAAAKSPAELEAETRAAVFTYFHAGV